MRACVHLRFRVSVAGCLGYDVLANDWVSGGATDMFQLLVV